MATILKLGVGAVKVTAKGIKVFTDVAQGKVPDLRIDEGEKSGPNPKLHLHMGDGPGQEITEGAINFLFGTASTYDLASKVTDSYNSINNEKYILASDNFLKSLEVYSPSSGLELKLENVYRA
jgi:hypothetical protein